MTVRSVNKVRPNALRPGGQKRRSRAAMLPKILLLLAVVGLIAAAPWAGKKAYRYVAARPFFFITEVRVSGLKHVRPDDFIRYMGDPRGKSILSYDMEGALGRIAAHPWIKDASMKREFPRFIRVEVLERTPEALADTGSGRFLIDGEGTALARVDGPEWEYLPVIQYPGAHKLKAADEKEARELRRALELLSCVRKDPTERLVGARLFIGEDGSPYMTLEGVVVKVGIGGYEEKVRRLSEVAVDIQRRGANPALIDLRFPGKVVVKDGRQPQSG